MIEGIYGSAYPSPPRRTNRSNRSSKLIRMASVRTDALSYAGGKCEYAYFADVWVDCRRQPDDEFNAKEDCLPAYNRFTTGDGAFPIDRLLSRQKEKNRVVRYKKIEICHAFLAFLLCCQSV